MSFVFETRIKVGDFVTIRIAEPTAPEKLRYGISKGSREEIDRSNFVRQEQYEQKMDRFNRLTGRCGQVVAVYGPQSAAVRVKSQPMPEEVTAAEIAEICLPQQ